MASSSLIQHENVMFKEIVKMGENDQLILNVEALEEILLNEHCEGKTVAIISIAGEYLSGKTLALECLARAFQNQNDTASSFPIHHGRGIFLTKRPVAIFEKEGAVVFLMDTSGLFDGFNRESNAKMFALSLLISSLQIFNVMRQLNSLLIEHLQYLIEFTRYQLCDFLSQENEDEPLERQLDTFKPFQQLVFFVRDWQFCSRHQFGEIGGREMLSAWLQKMPDFARCLNENFSSTNTKCYLLPNEQHPLFKPHLIDFVNLGTGRTELLKNFANIGQQDSVIHMVPVTCRQLCQFIFNLAEHFQLIIQGDPASGGNNMAVFRRNNLPFYGLRCEVDFHQLRADCTAYYRERMLSFLQEAGEPGRTAVTFQTLTERHNVVKVLAINALRRRGRFVRNNQPGINEQCVELERELDQLLRMFSDFSSILNADLKKKVTDLNKQLQEKKAQQVQVRTPPEKLKIERILLRSCCWLNDDYVYNDGTHCHKDGIWSDGIGRRYKEAWADFRSLTYASLKNQLGDDLWFSLPYRIIKHDPKQFVCTSTSRRLMAADEVIIEI